MSKHYTIFENQSAWESGVKDYPNVSLLDNGEVKYEPTSPAFSGKLLVKYDDGTEYEVVCDASSALTQGDVTGRSGYALSSITQAYVGECVTRIVGFSFYNMPNITNIELPSSLTTLDTWSICYCDGLLSVTCHATTPPSLGDKVFKSTNKCPIYVPASSVDAYKSASNWNSYASRIQAIPNS